MLPLNTAYGKSLCFPGRRAKLDLTHPAAQNIKFAGIAAGGNFLNLLQGTKGAIGGSPTSALDRVMGPATTYNGSADNSTFSGQSTVADTSSTMAAILVVTGGTGTYRTIFTTQTGGSGGFLLGISGATNDLLLTQEGGSSANSGIIPVFGVPYFFSASVNGVSSNFAIRRLDNGQMMIATNGPVGATAPNGTYQVGNDAAFARPLTGSVAAIVASAQFMTLQQLVQWANDPWGFWYATDFGPQAFPFIIGQSQLGPTPPPAGNPFGGSPLIRQATRVINI